MKAGIDYIGITTPFYCNDGKGNFLFNKRSKLCRDEHGTWEMGGGQVEFGETPEQSVLREVYEEYNCKGKIQMQLHPYSIFRIHGGIKTHWLALPFFILINPLQVKNNDPKKIEELGWFRLDNLPSPLHSALPQAFKLYRKNFNKFSK
jgi:8-oxo-dGTP pyrophosphatase MutT (NUDIX family)